MRALAGIGCWFAVLLFVAGCEREAPVGVAAPTATPETGAAHACACPVPDNRYTHVLRPWR